MVSCTYLLLCCFTEICNETEHSMYFDVHQKSVQKKIYFIQKFPIHRTPYYLKLF